MEQQSLKLRHKYNLKTESDRFNQERNSEYNALLKRLKEKTELKASTASKTLSLKRSLRPKSKRPNDSVTNPPVVLKQCVENKLRIVLDPDMANDDIKQIHDTWVKIVKVSSRSAHSQIFVKDGLLFYKQNMFQKGDNVTLSTKLSCMEYQVTITRISSNVLYVNLKDGTNIRVPIEHLVSGRSTVSLSNQH